MPLLQTNLDFNTLHRYFSEINPIARKIATDIDNTIVSYGEFWQTFSNYEQNDIINETLIRPEISVWYFDNTDFSLSIATLKSAASDLKEQSEPNIANYYMYDGRNLNTFCAQKVALKFINDEIFKPHRDEHSLPFSYRTKSQINFHLSDDPVKNLTQNGAEFVKKCTTQQNICLTTQCSNKELVKEKDCPENNAIVDIIMPNLKKIQMQSKNLKKSNNVIELLDYDATRRQPLPLKSQLHTSANSLYGNDECTTLIKQKKREILTSTELVVDEEDTICENIKLLSTDLNIRNRFDFLNNW